MSAVHRAVLLATLFAIALTALAQSADYFPAEPAYKGEIRRGADGRLIAVPATRTAPAASEARPATMRVGAGEKITSIGEAARLARDGEVIEIDAGDYRGPGVVWTQDRLLIRGAGARPQLYADGRNGEGRALWVLRGGRVRIENIAFSGAEGGAAISVERGEVVVHRCAFVDAGIVTADAAEATLAVSDSEFSASARRARAPLLAAGAIGRLQVAGSRFANGRGGSLLRSRARETLVEYNWLVAGGGERGAHAIDFPSGGVAHVIGNVLGESSDTLVAFGGEAPRWPDNALYLTHNTLLNDASGGGLLGVGEANFPAGVEVWAINNLVIGQGALTPPAAGRFEGNQRAPRHELLDEGGLPLRPGAQSALRGSVRLPGTARGVDLLPAAEFTFPVGSRPRRPASALLPGAFQ